MFGGVIDVIVVGVLVGVLWIFVLYCDFWFEVGKVVVW